MQSRIGWSLIGLAALTGAAYAQDGPAPDEEARMEELERSQAELLRRVEDQQAQLDELKKAQAEEAQAEAEAEEKGGAVIRWNELSARGHRIKFSGFIRLDVIYDDSRPNNTQTIGWVLSEDRNAPPSIGSSKDREDLTIHPRHTTFGWDYEAPTIAMLGDVKPTAKLEFDLYTPGFSESRQAIRLRHAYVKLTWDAFSLLAGQTSDLISPLYATVNPDLAMWGAGNLGDRRPQVRATYRPSLGPGTLELAGMIGLTGADDGADVDAAGTYGAGFRDGETSGLPTLQARVAYELPVFEKETLMLGAWVHGAWEDPDVVINDHSTFKSWAVGLDLTLPVFRNYVWIRGEVWTGTNVDDVRGGIFQGINAVTGRTIDATGGWVELGLRPPFAEWFTLTFGWSRDDPHNDDLNPGARASNKIAYVCTRYTFGPLLFGLDYMHWTTEYQGFHVGVDNRVQAFIRFNF